ncbi:alpha/beta hydrolase [Streptomyces griseofuscus]|uniref:Alpha/beta hydrolase n=1 Tax=Streptomyces griseofuscus TaxID=146922 RepID=A0A7H1PR84_9ACTN|nr:alpha/beta hydrolase [Streptomyces griseofuscus]QNT90564.1 alpha/beta hydrolase [Streptomyces griseofuscus]
MAAIPFDAALLDGYRAVRETGAGPMSLERLSSVRTEDAAEVPTLDELRRGGQFEVTSVPVPGASGASETELLICTPAAVAGPAASRPVLYFVHGGGYFSGDPRHLFFIKPLLSEAERLGASLISAGYRLAPEHPYPAPLDDVYAGLLWTAEHAAELGLDADRIVVAGTSAGGGLAAALSLSVRDKGGPQLVGQLLMCPMLDDRNDTASAHQMDGVDLWDRSWNGFGWTALLGSACGTPDVSPYAAPARATDLSGLPPAFIDVGSAETLRDEAVAYADRIWRAGGSAELHVWSGGYHAFDLVVPDAAISRAAWQARRSWLERVLAAA